ncbi:DUF2975 domain-containing protein [Maribacter algarum]|uniref:DUF2975 domain-containing protein n=1 Tax=Maribacter algarum (ex Zhang et al. 2020) TaxID=2578118 RepID=A0A5S3PUV7_9FLAO|nr:DUF2975 domain-containing protein [Maribacter algarum]TMM57972.1 DUF2975 domain-containing protein [Maribacter algarum]
MKKRTIISAKSLMIFLRYSLIGLFIWNVLHLMVFLIFHLGPAVLFGERKGVHLPIVFSPSNEGILTLPNTDYEYMFHIPAATGTFQAYGLPLKFFYLYSISILVYFACILLITYLIIKMLKNAENGTFLVINNAIRLRYIAILCIVTLLRDKVNIIASSHYLKDKIELPGLEFYDLAPYSFQNWKHIFLYLFLLIIAEAFRIGAQLKEENDLTI